MLDQIDKLEKAATRTLRRMAPPPLQTVSQWADSERRLSPEASAEAGCWNTGRAAYLGGIMDAINNPTIEHKQHYITSLGAGTVTKYFYKVGQVPKTD